MVRADVPGAVNLMARAGIRDDTADARSIPYFSILNPETPMIDPKAEALFKQLREPAPTVNEYQAEQLAIQKNREKLKAERLAREATAKPSTR